MKIAKPAVSKVNRDFSLPKLVNKIQHDKKLHEYQRLHFPRKDDTNFVRGVGRKHFESNISVSLQKLINPQSNNANTNKPNNIRMKTIEQQGQLNKKKYEIDRYYLQTQINEPPYARDIDINRIKKSRVDEIMRMKTNLDEKQRYRTESNRVVEVDGGVTNRHRNNGSLTIDTRLINRQDGLRNKISQNEYFSLKNRSSPEPVLHIMNKQDVRKFNPTYISSNF